MMAHFHDQDIDHEELVSSIVSGFEALLRKADRLAKQNTYLRQQLSEFQSQVRITLFLECQISYCREENT